ncbi:MAG TPA: 23S rRNA (uracil(1939)-C(5))-methyltransferase RlmD [Candidatus Limnocylindria bacterium]|nr:23S rRNA (uracil(1939)-C(5))-methyltransferase RlmD [Candidatus Limnocylindria bacterium]
MKVNDVLSLDLADLAIGGKSLARHDGRVVFVDRGLPGDHVRARLTRVRHSYAEARLESIEEHSADRVPTDCPHVHQCGGCRLLDLAYPVQCRIKERHVREALEHLAGIAAPPVRSLVPAPEIFGYRNKMEFSFHPGPQGAVLGLHERGTFDRVFSLATCLLPSALTVEIVRLTQRFAMDHGWAAYHARTHQGVVRFLTVRHLPATDQCGVSLVAASDAVPGIEQWARALAALSPTVRTVSLLLNRGRANVAVGEEERVLHGEGVLLERVLGLEFEVSAGAFLQTNSRQAGTLYETALRAAEIGSHETVLDLYCGTGTLTLMCARHARAAVGVESAGTAVACARRNAGRNRVTNARFVEGEARRVLREWARGERADGVQPAVVVVDPPRAGLHPRVVARVTELAPRRVVYVSCNPASLARDVKDFAARGYALAEVTPIDMFPHTPHIECVARLDRAAA